MALRYCSNCRKERQAEGGRAKTTSNGRVRFICAFCVSEITANALGVKGEVRLPVYQEESTKNC